MATDALGNPPSNPGAQSGAVSGPLELRAGYERRMAEARAHFEASGDGVAACRARSEAVDELIRALWAQSFDPRGNGLGICAVALGGFGRRQLFPFSDIDLLFCVEKSAALDRYKDPIRRLSQALWDCGLKVSPFTRAVGDCERFKPGDPEFSLALLDLRLITGESTTFAALKERILTRRSDRDARALASAAAGLTRERHRRFGYTLFHLEPNVKDAPGGLRDIHVCHWLARLRGERMDGEDTSAFDEATRFITATRVFLHGRHGRDDNTLDWQAQDEAAAQAIGLGRGRATGRPTSDAAYWMRVYYRQARAVERELVRQMERSGEQEKPSRAVFRLKVPPNSHLAVQEGVLHLKPADVSLDPARDSEIVLEAFGVMAETGIKLAPESETRIGEAIPALSATLEDGSRLWARLRVILRGVHAAESLREMHAQGVLELILPEFHGIDALVIRDAYHRYTVDEHTFVLLDTLHGLAADPPKGAPEWRLRFRSILRELPSPELLYLAALLHDTGKGRTASDHAAASAALATEVCARLELGPFETAQVVRLIECHLEMSAALRRDIFDTESVRVFADKVQTHDLLRMLTLFTYADISAVHPDALTPWKAENLWRLSMATANQLDRSVDAERVHTLGETGRREVEAMLRSFGQSPVERVALERFLEGFPERYLRTRSPQAIRQHMRAATGAAGAATTEEAGRVLLTYNGTVHEMTVVSKDRPQLFADLTAALAAWGMEVVTAEAFSNTGGDVVDTFRFTDPYHTLELNPEERERLLMDLRRVLETQFQPGRLHSGRRHRRQAPRRVVETCVEFDNQASSHSTLLQLVTQDVPGLLRATALALSAAGCSIEVALIDTEGEMAIDVFYLTRGGMKLDESQTEALRLDLLAAVEANAPR